MHQIGRVGTKAMLTQAIHLVGGELTISSSLPSTSQLELFPSSYTHLVPTDNKASELKQLLNCFFFNVKGIYPS